jgi:hypothetical protein
MNDIQINLINKSEELKKLSDDISDLKNFNTYLKREMTIDKQYRYSDVFIKRKILFSFLGFWGKKEEITIPIPEFMVAEIATKCQMWINELEIRANEMLDMKDKVKEEKK